MGTAALTLRRFAHALYDPAIEDASLSSDKLYIGAKGGHSRNLSDGRIEQIWKPISALDEWARMAEAFTDILPHNMNYTVALRSKADAKLSYTAGATCLWVDIDDVKYGLWSNKVLPELKRGPLCPNIAVDSGWGVHLYWLLSSMRDFMPEGVQDAARVQEFEKYNRILSWLVCGDIQSSSAAHLLRMPGSSNCKTEPYLKCKAMLVNDVRYSWDYIASKLDYIAEKSRAAGDNSINAVLNPPAKYKQPNTGLSGKTGYAVLEISADAAYNKLASKADGCPILRDMLQPPYSVGYMTWFAVACAIGRLMKPDDGAELFRKISLPGNTSPNPEHDINSAYSNVGDYMPSGCEKLGSYGACPLAQDGTCGNVIKYMRRTLQ